MGNEHVKCTINKYFNGEQLSNKDISLLKQEITQKTYLSYHLPGTETYFSDIHNLHTQVKLPLSRNDTYLNTVNSILTQLLTRSLRYQIPGIREHEFHFDSIPANKVVQYFLHSARAHHLREITIQEKECIFENIDIDKLKHVAWTDHDNNEYSGSLIFRIYGNNLFTGGVAVIDNNKETFKLYAGNIPITNTDMVNSCKIRSMFVAAGQEKRYEYLFNLGFLITFSE